MSDHASESTRANERTGTARTSSITYSTSQIAKIAGLHPNTVRMYEQWELIQKPARKQNEYCRGQEAKPGRRQTRRERPDTSSQSAVSLPKLKWFLSFGRGIADCPTKKHVSSPRPQYSVRR